MTVLDILNGARGLIAAGRWTQSSFEKEVEGQLCFCALGAVQASAHPETRYTWEGLSDETSQTITEARLALMNAVGADWAGAISVVGGFNDKPTTTRADVIALFDKAIAAEEAKTVPA